MLKHFPKILIIFFLTIFIFQLISLIFLFALPVASQAAAATFKPQVEIPGMKEEFGATDKTGGYAIPGSTASIAKYVRVIYKYAIGIVGILAAVVLMIGGVMWIVAGGSATRIGEAKAWIGASLTGLVIALMSYLILATINPALVDLKTTTVKTVEETTTNGQTLCNNGQGLCYTVCPESPNESWKEVNAPGECDWQKCCVLYSGACGTPPPKGLGGSCRTPKPEGEGCLAGEKVEPNGYCGGNTKISICCMAGE